MAFPVDNRQSAKLKVKPAVAKPTEPLRPFSTLAALASLCNPRNHYKCPSRGDLNTTRSFAVDICLKSKQLTLYNPIWIVVKVMLPFLGTLNIPKGTMILTSTHINAGLQVSHLPWRIGGLSK